MKIALDITTAGLVDGDRGGVYRYIVKLIENLKGIDHDSQYILFFNYMNPRHRDTTNRFFNQIRGTNFCKVVSLFPPPVRMKLRIPLEWFIGPIDILHSPVHWTSPVGKAKSIVTIHDLAYLKRDKLEFEWRCALKTRVKFTQNAIGQIKKRQYFFSQIERHTASSIKNSERIIAVSQSTKNDILQNFPDAEDKVRVIYEGLAEHFRPVKETGRIETMKKQYGITSPYILFLGNLDPNKNLIRLLEAFQILKKETKIPHQLVIGGVKTWYFEILLEETKRFGIDNEVIFTGYLPDEELPILYSGAEMFILPSFLEGFGLPVLEAMACGVPVVAANKGALPEIVGSAGILVDPYDVQAMAHSLLRLIQHQELKLELIEKGFKRVKIFSWGKMARETLNLYHEVMAEA